MREFAERLHTIRFGSQLYLLRRIIFRSDSSLRVMKSQWLRVSGNVLSISPLFSLLGTQSPSYYSALTRNNSSSSEYDRVRFEKLVQTRCKSGNLELNEALGYFNTLIKMRPWPFIWAFNQLFGALSKKNHCSTIVSILGRWEEAQRFLVDMIHRGISPNVQTFTVLIDSLCMEYKTQEAISLCIEPNVVTFNSVISALCKSSRSNEAAQFLENMTSHGIELGGQLDQVAYATLIKGFCLQG
ncbi:Pentatricopeptide repeat [Parasponia andersonii]|uniref:Pentatricopeptide repeat n=1 Tax=Parasponia andersonii TaxID=3476 RepID=A0A2P5D4J8_PARAD|nr:Pentatricopeptide repeat [Parasponia andersonii]